MSQPTRIFLHETGLMQALLTQVSHGYHFHYGGLIDAAGVVAFIEQIEVDFQIGASPRQRQYRRDRYGRANAFLHLHPSYKAPAFRWWLLLTDGAHAAPALDMRLKDAREGGPHRVMVPGDYEAVVRPAPGGARRRTWQRTSPSYEGFVTRIRQAIQQQPDRRQITRVLKEVHGLAAFRGVRVQIAALRRVARDEWRQGGNGGVLPLPPFPPYVRYRNFATLPLEIVRDRLLAGQKPFRWDEMRAPEPERGSE